MGNLSLELCQELRIARTLYQGSNCLMPVVVAIGHISYALILLLPTAGILDALYSAICIGASNVSHSLIILQYE